MSFTISLLLNISGRTVLSDTKIPSGRFERLKVNDNNRRSCLPIRTCEWFFIRLIKFSGLTIFFRLMISSVPSTVSFYNKSKDIFNL